ncbi:peptidase U34 [Thermosipho ferrireducens]|uniref:Peptidase U34 n=1 Tax=Thermosipho ferrireducens TaxID=2571116 RepID=A0ABX7S8H5_9BACT|nr:carcinine hydrolase/isopenicillin-N N-acyltransferase family protein [Thermosipho ferrireducens]QTA37576.1 peptidase U34 [Thermosipho ferrireducens]
MCDTFVALSNVTKDNSIIFAKNSDREPAEPHIGIFVERKKHNEKKVKCTYIEVDQVPETYACMLFKPSWIWGAEMGINEYGVVIGNEAVFTKLISKEESLIGMDYVRLALERSKNTEEAVEVIIKLLKQYGQGGKCGYKKNLTYDNSYMIVDFNKAFVLETAGREWAVKEIKDFDSISNSLSIKKDHFKSSVGKDIDFKATFERRLIAKVASGDFRRALTREELRKRRGNIDLNNVFKITRIHTNSKNIFNGSMKNICMHAWSLISSETTGSIVVKLKDGEIQIFATLSPRPCLSVYKPLLFNGKFLFSENETRKAIKYWQKRRKLVLELSKNKTLANEFILQRDKLEKRALNMEWNEGNIEEIWKEEEKLISKFL